MAPPHCFAMESWSSSPYINRFLSADTVVPSYANPQDLNLYSYVLNNPLRYTDPTGHRCIEAGFEGGCKAVEEKMTKKWKADLEAKRNKEKEKSKEEKRHDIIRRGAEFAFGAALFGLGLVVTAGGLAIAGFAVAKATAGVATGPGEFLIAPHAASVAAVGIFFMVPIGVTSIVAGYKTMKDALTP